MLRLAFPVHTTAPDGRETIGSAFLASCNGRAYLMTAAHVPPGDHPSSDWTTWPDMMNVHVAAGYYEVALFSTDGGRSPRFGYYQNRGPELADALWMPIEMLGDAGAVLRDQVQTHILDKEIEVPAGTPLQVHGFPHVEPTWPPQIQVADGAVLRVVEGPMIEVDIATVGGFSEGPALHKSTGQLLGLHIGHHPEITDPGRIVPAPLLRGFVDNNPM